MSLHHTARRRASGSWVIMLLALAGLVGLVYGSLAQTPMALLSEVHRASRLTLVMSFPSFTAAGHFFAYALAAGGWAVVTSFSGHWHSGLGRQILPYSGLAMLAIALEVAQLGTATRSFDWVDLIAGVAGVGVVAPAMLLLAVRSQPD